MKLKVYFGDKNTEVVVTVPEQYYLDNFILLCINKGYIPAVFEYTAVKIIIPWKEVKYIALIE